MKKILFLYGSFGGGHLSAAKSLKEYIDEHYPETETKLVDCLEYVSKHINKVSVSTYEYIIKKAPSIWGKIYKSSEKGVFAKISKNVNKQISNKLKKCIIDFEPDLIVSTHPFASQMCSILKKSGKINCSICTVLTDFHIHKQWITNPEYVDYYFVSNFQMKEDMMSQGIGENKIFVSGIPVSERFLDEFNKEKICSEFKLNPEKPIALFFAGGAHGVAKGQTFEVFRSLMKDFPELQVVAVAGKNEKVKKTFEECAKAFHRENNACILPFTDKVPELMHIANFVITKPGGLTTTECFVSGLPMIVINPIAGHEEQNAEFLENVGVGIWLRKNDNIKETFDTLLSSPEKLNQMSKNALNLAKPNSIKEIVEKLMK